MSGRYKTHLFVPDTQVREDVPTDHIKALANYILDKQPDRIILAGDWFDMPATSRWNSAQEREGLRISDDIDSGNRALSQLFTPLEKHRRKYRRRKAVYSPDLQITLGNHEHHIVRAVEENPQLHGILGYHLLHFERYGIKVHEFLKPVLLDGIAYCHYFANPNTGRAYSGQIETRIKNIGRSFTQGHSQSFAYGELERATGEIHHGMVAGCFYMHNEKYKGPQGNNHWRGVVMKHEVRNGQYDIMKVSLGFLLRRYL